MRHLLACLVLGCCLSLGLPVAVTGAGAAGAEGAYAPPVDGPVVDGWRPPSTPYGPGNRGLDFGTSPGEAVRAASDGVVVFAGAVGLSRHVVVLHPDGIRTSYSFLATVSVRRGDHLVRGDVVGTAGERVHFGARLGDDRYLDPSLLLDGRPPPVHLVPVEQRRIGSEASERRHLLRSLAAAVAGGTLRAGAAGVAWAREAAGDVVSLTRQQVADLLLLLDLVQHYYELPARMVTLSRRAMSFFASQRGCTPASTPPRAPPPGRHRIAILVAGFGSSSTTGAVRDVDTAALGYAPDEVAVFSYRGGQTSPSLPGVPVTSYSADDSQGDIRVAAGRLRELLEAVRREHPGVPVDLIAHSQGGLVARAALGEDVDHLDPRLPPIEHLITLGTPHHGSDLATLNAALGESTVGQLAQSVVRHVTGGGTDPTSVAAGQLAETSGFVDDLADRPLPRGTRVTSIAARGDLVVPALSAQLPGATNALVPLQGTSAHDRLPGSPEAGREIALALADMGPTCRNLLDDVFVAAGVSMLEQGIGMLATRAALPLRGAAR